MDGVRKAIDIIRHLDRYLDWVTQQYGGWSYAILGAIIFIETGFVVMPFLPGDSLLFACGAISMRNESGLNPLVLGVILTVCAIAGDTVNYHAGKVAGPRVMKSETSRWLNKKHLEATAKFFEKYGGKTIILARFVPIVRTFAAFVAGAGAMNYGRFIVYNVVGAVAWVTSMMGAGRADGGREEELRARRHRHHRAERDADGLRGLQGQEDEGRLTSSEAPPWTPSDRRD